MSVVTKLGSGNKKAVARKRRHFRVRKRISGTAARPRLVVSRSARHIVAQIVDDLPDSRIGAGRDLIGVKKCILDAVQQAQGKGCGPGVLGVIVGGDRATGYLASKEQFLRRMRDKNPNPVLAKLEEECLGEANQLGIGPMGFGGKTTLLGVKICAANRVPASYFVSVSYMCWAYRRQGVTLGADGEIQKWLY